MIVLRNLLFYLAFYLGSPGYVLLAAAQYALGMNQAFRLTVERWSRFHAAIARNLLGIKLVVEGEIPKGPILIAMKHQSFYEAIYVPGFFDRPVVFAKAELMRIPVWGKVGQRYGLIAVHRDQGASALRKMLAAAKAYSAEGRPLVIFPEGTRVPFGQRGELQAGFAGLYKLLGLPVVPIAANSGPLYHRWLKRAGTVTYRIGETIPPGLPREEIEARVQDAINALNGPAA
ncbi:MAG: lysophospholipid acyltransferase family protein [Pseudomonadota bacterium]|nr:lysophospholipid acyltransferase family protein [Pseudomonadota bacterium]